MELRSNDRTIRLILTSQYFFIPRFQRPYSWSVENIDELWEDAVQDNAGDYFIGAMVVYPTTDDTVALIDGQQRLTTIVMLLCALRDIAAQYGFDSLANGTHIFVERTDENDIARFILNTETSYPFLHDEIMMRGDAELEVKVGSEELRLQKAFSRLVTLLTGVVKSVESDTLIAEDQRPEVIERKLREIRDRILGLRVIFIEVGDADDGTTIFVTLNSRGEDLEPADLVKAHLLQLLPKKGALDRPLEQWQSIVQRFDQSSTSIGLTDFLLAVWRSRYESRVTAKTVTKAVRKRIKKDEADPFLKALGADSVLYRQVVEPSARKWGNDESAARESLQFLQDFHISQPMPLLLSLLREFDGKRLSLKQIGRAYRAIEDYHFMYNTIGSKTSSGGMSSFYASRAIALFHTEDVDKRAVQIDDLVKELRKRRPSDVEFDEAFGSLWFTDESTADKKTIQYILRRHYQFHNPGIHLELSKMTIEHLSPQASAGEEVGRLGNLILISKDLNGKLGNRAPQEKIAMLAEASEWVPPDVLTLAMDPESIKARTKQLTMEARTKIWRG